MAASKLVPDLDFAQLCDRNLNFLNHPSVELVARFATLEEAVTRTLELPATLELVDLLGSRSTLRMRRSLERRWGRYADHSEVRIPGEQLVAAASP